jgi:hypothetical protein
MSAHHCYRGMEYSEDHKQIAEWAPLIVEGAMPIRHRRHPHGHRRRRGTAPSAN